MEMTNVLSKQILDRLSKIQRLPEQGFLCGGAVANTILSIIDGKEYPINDLDVFLFENVTHDSGTPLRSPINELATDGYNNRIIIPSRKLNYRIIRTTNVGMINYVYVYFHTLHESCPDFNQDKLIKENYSAILQSFDINCCKVGIDLATGELYIESDFQNFIRNRQLECVNPVTPAHTILRLLKKRDDLNVYLNKDDQFKYLSQFFNYHLGAYYSKFNITLFFGEKYKQIFHKYENEVSEYFELWSYGKKYRHNINKQSLQIMEINNFRWWEYQPHCVDADVEAVHRSYQKKLWTLHPIKYNELDEEIKKYYQKESNNPLVIKRLWELLYKTTKKQKNKIVKLLVEPELYPFIIVGDDFYNCDFNEQNIERLVKFIKENPDFGMLIQMTTLNFQESERLMNMIKNSFPMEIELFCELIAKEVGDEIYFKSDFNKKLVLDKDYITKKFTLVKNILSKELIQKIDLSDFEYNNIIKELVTPLDLLWGGKFMHNCIKGYVENGFKDRIGNGEIRVFIISDENERTAFQISKSYSNVYKIDQIYGHSNTTVCNKHNMIVKYLISFLEYKHYLSESQNIITKFEKDRSDLIKLVEESNYEKVENQKKSRFGIHQVPYHINEVVPIPDVLENIPQIFDEPTVVTNGLTINGIRYDIDELDDIINDEDEEELY